MYAIIETGGKQHRVTPGEVVALEKVPGDAGAQVAFDNVLMVSTDKGLTVGQPHVAGAKVIATIVEQFRAKKILVFKKKRRKKYRRTQGHRQYHTRVRIDSITA
ncbi:MAG: 50S ribosomal protein L21 [Nitrospirae bacterium]|nr:50S ribosomal protein L21 [Nitrospirota bacterium]